MAAFTYDGLNRQGQSVHGEVVADNSNAAIEKLREAGVLVTDINEKVVKQARRRGGKKVTLTDTALFSRQLAAMLSAGVPVTRALSTLAKQRIPRLPRRLMILRKTSKAAVRWQMRLHNIRKFLTSCLSL